MKSSFIAIAIFLLSLFSTPSIAESCEAEVVLEDATQDDDGWVNTEVTVLVSNCVRSQGTFNYTIHWADADDESGKVIRSVGNWGPQATDQVIQVTERDKLAADQLLDRIEVEEVSTCVCFDSPAADQPEK